MSRKLKVLKQEAVLGLKHISTPQLIANTKLYLQKMTGNPNFPAPSPSLTLVFGQLTKLEASYTVSQSRALGTASQMQTDKKALIILLKALAAYVELIANADPDNAVAIIESSGMRVKRKGTPPPKIFSVVLSKDPNTVELNTKAETGGIYLYEMSTDPNNPASWGMVVFSKQVKCTKSGLTSGVRYYFRVAVIIKTVQGPWSPVLNVIIP
jgi:hypothetical protein